MPASGDTPAFRHYRVCGLLVRSELNLPGVAPSPMEDTFDVEVRLARNLAMSDEVLASKGVWEAGRTQFLLTLPGAGKFLVSDGTTIDVEPDEDVDMGNVYTFVLGTCFAALIHQRGDVVLHASAVNIGAGAALFCGRSGAGKSTLAAALSTAGYPLLCDDFCVIRPENGRYVTLSDSRRLKLVPDAVKELSFERAVVGPTNRERQKFLVDPVSRDDLMARPVVAVYMLDEATSAAAPEIVRLNALEAMAALRRNVFRHAMLSAMGLETKFFDLSGKLQQQAKIYGLRRAKSFEQMSSVIGMLESHWTQLELGTPEAKLTEVEAFR